MQNSSSFARQRVLIVAGVLLLHALALWGLQSGLLQRAAALVEDIVVPVTVITEAPVVSKPAPQPAPPPLQSRAAPAPAPTPTPMAPAPVAPAPQQAAPLPQATAEATPAANAATGSLQAQAAPAAAAPSPLPAPAIKAELPLVEADYLVKPNREFPRRCLRRREQGTVVVHVLIGVDGHADKAEIGSSSGFECLNREALDTALSAQYKPVMRGGVAVQVWRDASFKYVLPE